MGIVLRIVVALAAVWLAFVVLGWIFNTFTTLLVIAGVATLGVVAYGAIKGKTSRQIKP